MSDMVVMGRIVAPYGVLGWVKVSPETELVDGLLGYDTWWLGKGKSWQAHKVEKAKVHNDILLVKLQGINDRDIAIAAKGKQVSVPKEALPETEEGEYYWSDLIGLQVTNQQEISFGKIVDVFETGANDVLVVGNKVNNASKDDLKEKPSNKGKKPNYNERLIPFIASVIKDVDLENKKMIVDWDEAF